MDTKGAKNRERLDLGLEAILAGVENPRPEEITIDLGPGQATREPLSWTLGDAPPPPPKNEFEALADDRKWSEIVRLAEARLAEGDDAEVKLWWIRGHLGAFSMPVSFLSAPFEAVCRRLPPEGVPGSCKVLLEETGLLVLQRLREVSDVSQGNEVRSSLERLGIKEPRGGRERVGTSSFRSLESVVPVAARPVPAPKAIPEISSSPRKRVAWIVLCTCVVSSLVALDRLFLYIRSAPLDMASEGFEPPHTPFEQATDTPARRDPGGRLGALFYSLGAAARTEPLTAVSPDSGPLAVAKPQPEVIDEPSPTRSKEEINTSGPVEGPEFRERIERVPPPAPERRRQELQGGSPRAVLPGSSAPEFQEQRTYRVLTRKSVLSAPSYGGRVLGQLEPGDRVLVEGKLGRWLRLRSKKGRGGYVLRADVEEASDLDMAASR
jgi:hypothetical protein